MGFPKLIFLHMQFIAKIIGTDEAKINDANCPVRCVMKTKGGASSVKCLSSCLTSAVWCRLILTIIDFRRDYMPQIG